MHGDSLCLNVSGCVDGYLFFRLLPLWKALYGQEPGLVSQWSFDRNQSAPPSDSVRNVKGTLTVTTSMFLVFLEMPCGLMVTRQA